MKICIYLLFQSFVDLRFMMEFHHGCASLAGPRLCGGDVEIQEVLASTIDGVPGLSIARPPYGTGHNRHTLLI